MHSGTASQISAPTAMPRLCLFLHREVTDSPGQHRDGTGTLIDNDECCIRCVIRNPMHIFGGSPVPIIMRRQVTKVGLAPDMRYARGSAHAGDTREFVAELNYSTSPAPVKLPDCFDGENGFCLTAAHTRFVC
jgi:hypothetical protein